MNCCLVPKGWQQWRQPAANRSYPSLVPCRRWSTIQTINVPVVGHQRKRKKNLNHYHNYRLGTGPIFPRKKNGEIYQTVVCTHTVTHRNVASFVTAFIEEMVSSIRRRRRVTEWKRTVTITVGHWIGSHVPRWHPRTAVISQRQGTLVFTMFQIGPLKWQSVVGLCRVRGIFNWASEFNFDISKGTDINWVDVSRDSWKVISSYFRSCGDILRRCRIVRA